MKPFTEIIENTFLVIKLKELAVEQDKNEIDRLRESILDEVLNNYDLSEYDECRVSIEDEGEDIILEVKTSKGLYGYRYTIKALYDSEVSAIKKEFAIVQIII